MTEIVTLKVRASRRQGVPFSTLPSSLATSRAATVLRARLVHASNRGHVGEHRSGTELLPGRPVIPCSPPAGVSALDFAYANQSGQPVNVAGPSRVAAPSDAICSSP